MTGKRFGIALLSSLALFASAQAQLESLEKLADDFWTWRAKYAPFTGDDVNRMERPGGTRDWSRASIDRRHKDLEQFEARWKKIDPSGWPSSAAGRLQIDRLRAVTGSLGTRHQSALETRSEFLHRADAHRAGGSAHHSARLTMRHGAARFSHASKIFRRSCSKARRTSTIRRRRLQASRSRTSTAFATVCAKWRARW